MTRQALPVPAVLNTVLATAIAAVLFAAPHVAFAAEEETGGLEEIMVTAQKREQRVQDVPTTVSVLSAEDLRSSNVTEVNQLSTISPGIFINSDQTGRNTQIKIRGIGPDDQSNLRPAIGFFYNDIPLMTQLQGGLSVASDLDLGDVERVEVLKGPQSTLFGESVSGGAISFFNRRPRLTDEFNGRVAVTAGDHNLLQVRGSIGAPLGDKFAFRVAGSRNTREGQVLNTLDGNYAKFEGRSYSMQLLFQPLDNLSFTLEHNRRISEQHAGANDDMDLVSYGPTEIATAAAQGVILTPADPFDRKVQMLYPFDEVMSNTLTSLHAVWDINDQWSLTSVTGYQTNKDHYYGAEGQNIGGNIVKGYNASNGTTVGFFAVGTQKIRYTTEELRVNFNGEKLHSMFGVFYGDYQAPQSRGDFGFVIPNENGEYYPAEGVFIFPLAQFIAVDKQTSSVFTHNSFKFTDAWEVVFGARYTKEKAEGPNGLLNFVGDYSGVPLDTSAFPYGKSDENAWGGTAKVIFHINDKFSLYAGMDRGFRLGGINNIGQPNYDTEIALNSEVGLKGLFFDDTLRANLSIYHTKYTGYQVVSYNSDEFTFITQNADVTGKGVELEVLWLPIRQLELGANLGYNESKYDKFRGATCDNYQNANGLCPNDPLTEGGEPVIGAQNLDGRDLSQAPKFTGSLTAQYTNTLPISSGFDWFVRGEYFYRGEAFAHPVGKNGDPDQLIDSYGVVNASVGLSSDKGWDLKLWCKNVTDKDYFLNKTRQPVGSGPENMTARIGMERNFGLTLSHSF